MLAELYDKAVVLFNYRKIGGAFSEKGEMNKALIFLGLSILANVVIQVVTEIEAGYFGIFSYETLAEVVPVEELIISWDPVIPFTLSRLAILVPFMFLSAYVFEWIAFKLLRITGGKGTFVRQFYYASIISFAVTLSSLILLLSPIPCAGLTFVLAYIVLSMYFSIYVTSKSYQVIHEVGLKHALAIVLLLIIPRVVAILAINEIFGAFNLPLAPFEVGNYV